VNEPAASIAEQLSSALALHQRGQLSEAKAVYEQLLRIDPGHVEALHLLGVIAYQQKQFGQAVTLINRAIAASPENAMLYANRGVALRELK
jgi:Flp pilus assembly protein TadD